MIYSSFMVLTLMQALDKVHYMHDCTAQIVWDK